MIGSRLGHYRVTAAIGSGSMGEPSRVAPDGQRVLVTEQDGPMPPLTLVQNWPSLLARRPAPEIHE